MPQTQFDIEQADFVGGSGTFTAGEELESASGFLQTDIFRVEGEIFPRASGLVDSIIHVIPGKGDETDSKPRTKFEIPVNEYVKSVDASTFWSLRRPFGLPASGIRFYTAFFVESPAAQNIEFEVSTKPVAIGTLLGPLASGLIDTLSANITANEVQLSTITIPVDPPSQFLSFKFTRKGTTDTFDDSVFVVAHGVEFL